MDQSTAPNPLLANKKLGLLLSTKPENPNAETVYQLSKTALANKVDTYLYFIDEGVLNLQDPRFIELAKNGLKLFVCAYGCQQHHISTERLRQRKSIFAASSSSPTSSTAATVSSPSINTPGSS